MQPKADFWTFYKSLICFYDSQGGPIWMIPTPIFFILHPLSSTTKLFGSKHSKMRLPKEQCK
jgi:hypothetical protein